MAAPCQISHTEPYDFASCATHDTTLPLGGTCRFDGREPWEVYAELPGFTAPADREDPS